MSSISYIMFGEILGKSVKNNKKRLKTAVFCCASGKFWYFLVAT